MLGGVVGLERELSGKPAGLRTNILICVGAAIITDLSVLIALNAPTRTADPARLAAQIVTGIGFLGAGTILQTRGSIQGLTSAATIWVVAAIGMLCGAGAVAAAVGSTILVIIVLVLLARFEDIITARRVVRGSVRVSLDVSVEEIETILRENGLRIFEIDVHETSRSRLIELRVRGSTSRLRNAAEELDDRNGVLDIDLD